MKLQTTRAALRALTRRVETLEEALEKALEESLGKPEERALKEPPDVARKKASEKARKQTRQFAPSGSGDAARDTVLSFAADGSDTCAPGASEPPFGAGSMASARTELGATADAAAAEATLLAQWDNLYAYNGTRQRGAAL